jgi:hypothetical protein
MVPIIELSNICANKLDTNKTVCCSYNSPCFGLHVVSSQKMHWKESNYLNKDVTLEWFAGEISADVTLEWFAGEISAKLAKLISHYVDVSSEWRIEEKNNH